jgi:hypothetical protein
VTLKGERIAEEFQAIVDAYVNQRYGPGRSSPSIKEIPIKAV